HLRRTLRDRRARRVERRGALGVVVEELDRPALDGAPRRQKKGAVASDGASQREKALVRQASELDQLFDLRCTRGACALAMLAVHHDHQTLALRVGGAAANVEPAAANPLAIQVA